AVLGGAAALALPGPAAAGGAALGLGGMLAAGWAALRAQRRALAALLAQFDLIAAGDFQAPMPSPAAAEFHALSSRTRALRARLGYALQERRENERRAAEDRRAAIAEMAGRVEAEARRAVAAVSERTGAMSSRAAAMAESSGALRARAAQADAAADQARGNVQAVAAATEELAASIREITSQTARAGQVARAAVEGSDATQGTIRALAGTVSRIGEVVTLIREIAARTNLLALNATIEAARAGEAGKGFAVVASEVKELATQTARGTEEIGRQIAGIEGETRAAVSAVDGIGRTIAEINEVTTAIAAAMEQQAAATQEIARNVGESSLAVDEVTAGMAAVSAEAGRGGAEAGGVRAAAQAAFEDVAAMQGTLVRMIRTSMAEAERRAEPRAALRLPCRLLLPAGETRGELLDASPSGARVRAPGLAEGQEGRMLLDGAGVDIPFAVAHAEAGEAGLRLDRAAGGAAWARTLAGARAAAAA
ncbi:methyl-accepting chemotaxis protein, partial [Roseococcus sp. DSY-14]|uniref:methyl-accepting chemotaxis protein n=1 Tax=Roseococcus sp. DSY-14 TaxID=3369650 RepID=UPI00387AE4DE